MTSLKGAPKIVEGDFDCYDKLVSLKGAFKISEDDFNLTDKDIEWLKQNCDIKRRNNL